MANFGELTVSKMFDTDSTDNLPTVKNCGELQVKDLIVDPHLIILVVTLGRYQGVTAVSMKMDDCLWAVVLCSLVETD
jgi:hypothetical protein